MVTFIPTKKCAISTKENANEFLTDFTRLVRQSKKVPEKCRLTCFLFFFLDSDDGNDDNVDMDIDDESCDLNAPTDTLDFDQYDDILDFDQQHDTQHDTLEHESDDESDYDALQYEPNVGDLSYEDITGMKLYEIKERYNISRSGYRAMIRCFNKRQMKRYGNIEYTQPIRAYGN